MKDKIDFSLLISSSLFVINRPINFNKVAEIWDNINLTSKEEVVIKALRIILPDVEPTARKVGADGWTENSDIERKLKKLSSYVVLC